MKEPKYNDYFPLNEYEQRIRNIRTELIRNGLDAVFLAAQQNVDYASGFLHGTWTHGFGEGKQQVLITADPDDEPVLIAPESLRGCLDTTAISDIRVTTDLVYGGSIHEICKIFNEKKLTHAKVGIENNPNERMGFTNPFYNLLRGSLPDVSWIDCTGLMYSVRKIKSPLEIAKIRKAVEITCKAYEAALDEIREGMSEKELASLIALEMARLSTDAYVRNPWFIYVHADGKNPIGWDGIPSGYRFKKGDCIYVDSGFIYHGYSADIIRVASIGEPAAEKARIYYGARDANMALIKHIKPGMKCNQLYNFLNEKMIELGFGAEVKKMKEYGFIYEGHGIGLSVHEPPVINHTNEDLIEEGMTLAIEGNIFNELPLERTSIALKNEENILITAEGSELLSTVSNDIWVSKR